MMSKHIGRLIVLSAFVALCAIVLFPAEAKCGYTSTYKNNGVKHQQPLRHNLHGFLFKRGYPRRHLHVHYPGKFRGLRKFRVKVRGKYRFGRKRGHGKYRGLKIFRGKAKGRYNFGTKIGLGKYRGLKKFRRGRGKYSFGKRRRYGKHRGLKKRRGRGKGRYRNKKNRRRGYGGKYRGPRKYIAGKKRRGPGKFKKGYPKKKKLDKNC